MLPTEWGSTRELLRQYESDHRALIKKLATMKEVQPNTFLKSLHGNFFRYSNGTPFLTAKRGFSFEISASSLREAIQWTFPLQPCHAT
jgi:hypothetical protein